MGVIKGDFPDHPMREIPLDEFLRRQQELLEEEGGVAAVLVVEQRIDDVNFVVRVATSSPDILRNLGMLTMATEYIKEDRHEP